MTATARAAIGVLVAAALLLAYFVLVPRDYYTGTNAIRTRGTLIELNKNARTLCLPGLQVPAGTGRMEVELDTGGVPRAPMAFTLDVAGRRSTARLPAGPAGRQKVAFSFPRTRGAPATQPGRACIRTTGAGKLFFGGVPGIPEGERPPTVDGTAQDARAAIWYRPPGGEQASIASRLPELFRRMALFKPTWTGAWTYWLLFLLVTPALVFAAVRLLVAPDRPRRLPLAVLIGLLGFANAAVWAHVTPAFNSPDESEHFAYVQSLAERGEPLDATPSERTPYSSQEQLGIRLTRVLDGAETADGKPPWLARDDALYDELERRRPARDDGGGFATSGSSHSPLYYGLGVPAYVAARGGGLFDALVAVRLVSALLGGLVAACAFLVVRELAPRRRGLAAVAGVAVAFQPMFAFISGSVNSDVGVNAGAAVVTLLLVRLLRRGFSWRLAAGLGLAVGLTPLLKGTGYALYPAAALALAVAAWRARGEWRAWVPGAIVVVGALIAVSVAWSQVSGLLDRGTFTTPGGGAPGEGSLALQQPGGTLVYIWEIFLPQLPGMDEHWSQSWPAFDIFGLRGWGAFGWYAVSWPHGVYWVIMLAMLALTALGLTALWRRGTWLRGRAGELLVLLAVVGGVIGVMTAAYYSPTRQGDTYPIQGRYVFPAMAALAALFAGSTLAVGRRFAGPLAVALSTAVVCLGYASLWLVLSEFYFAAR